LPTAITKVEDICTNIKDLDNYSLNKLGEIGLPKDVALPSAIDSGFGLPDYTQEML
jgi:hypothetical protein